MNERAVNEKESGERVNTGEDSSARAEQRGEKEKENEKGKRRRRDKRQETRRALREERRRRKNQQTESVHQLKKGALINKFGWRLGLESLVFRFFATAFFHFFLPCLPV